MIFPRTARVAAFALFLGSLTACDSFNDIIKSDKLDYKSASQQRIKGLDVPPDLSTIPNDDRFAIPGATTSLSGYNQQRSSYDSTKGAASDVLPLVQDAHLERAGGQRWLVVKKSPEDLWPIVREFWQDNGFVLKTDSPKTGIMETDWAENRAKIPQDFIRNTLGKLLDSVYDTGERDKFRTRIERRADGGSEIYISHRGMVEVYTSAMKDTTVWTQRPTDPELEAEFLDRLLVRLGVDQQRAKEILATNAAAGTATDAQGKGVTRAKLVTASGGQGYVEVEDPFDRAWRRVGLALDRVNFTVEDRDRTQGVYFVRYVDPAADAKDKPGFLSRIFSSSDSGKLANQYRVVVTTQANGHTTRVMVQNQDGKPDASDVGPRILALLSEQLK